MIMRGQLALALALLAVACGAVAARKNITVSGLSSGGFFAHQFQVAYSSEVLGAAIVAGGPYWCANDNLVVALTACMNESALIDVDELVRATEYAFLTLTIDDPDHMRKQRAFVFSGTQDSVVEPGVSRKLVDYLKRYMDAAKIDVVMDVPAEHAFATDSFGHECGYLGSPYINDCDYDLAGALLASILDEPLHPRTAPNDSAILVIDQSQYIPGLVPPATVGLGDTAYAYIPHDCRGADMAECRLHVAFHGCLQSVAKIGSDFYLRTGLNAWAESNRIVVLYPQAQANVLNPKACWDWWGYTGPAYACQVGVQMATVKAMIDDLNAGSGGAVTATAGLVGFT